MKVEILGNQMVITVPIAADPQPSASGKTLIVYSSKGNVSTAVQIKGKPVIIGLNCYTKR